MREIERRIEKSDSRSSEDLDVPSRPAGIPEDIEEHIKLMMDLQVLAWQADITRVTTFQLASELSNTVYPVSGIRDAFHILSHHSHIEENKQRFAVLNRYHVGLLSYLLENLDSLAGGALEGGRHLRHAPDTTMSNLLLALLHRLGIEQDSFGDSTGVLAV